MATSKKNSKIGKLGSAIESNKKLNFPKSDLAFLKIDNGHFSIERKVLSSSNNKPPIRFGGNKR